MIDNPMITYRQTGLTVLESQDVAVIYAERRRQAAKKKVDPAVSAPSDTKGTKFDVSG